MTKAFLGWAATASLVTLVGCGSGGGSFEDDTGTGGPDSSMVGDGPSDGTTSDTPSLGDTGGGDSTISDTGAPTDGGGLDISLPDGFTSPDMGTDTSSGDDTGMMSGCSPDGITCSGSTAIDCSGGKATMTSCTGGTPVCAPGFGCVVCDPGSGSCSGSTGTVCKSDGSGYTTNSCDPLLGLTCSGGVCTGDCADIGESYIGCEYYAITMANDQLDQSIFGYYVALANQDTSSATITITGGALTTATTVTLPAGSIQEIQLPWVPALSTSQATTIDAAGAYHIKSTEPITAYQFNAKDYEVSGTYSYTNDASLLLPVNAMTGTYRVAAWPSWLFEDSEQFAGTIAVVGTVAGTKVTVTPPSGSPYQAGAGLAVNGGTVTLNAGDVLQIGTVLNATDTAYGTDPSGTLISATNPVEVFGGSDCTYVPATVPACDHLEEIQFPVETLGTQYLVTLPDNANGAPQQYVKIVGTAAGTTLTYDPPTGYVTAPATSVGAGGVVFFQTKQNFHVTASQPIAVAQIMESENNFTPSDTAGDPSMSMAVATAQFRTSYGFTAPPNYIQSYVNVIAPSGSTVTVTDTPTNHTVTTGTAIGSSGYYLAYVSLCANNLTGCTGNHTATSSSAFGIQVYGYGSYTSLMYPGGLNLTR